MALLVPNEGEVKILSVALGKDAAEDLLPCVCLIWPISFDKPLRCKECLLPVH